MCAVTRKPFTKSQLQFVVTNAKKSFTRADNLKAHQKVCSKYFFFNLFDLEIKYFIRGKSSVYNKILNLKLILFLLERSQTPENLSEIPVKNSVEVANSKFIYFNGLILNEHNRFS